MKSERAVGFVGHNDASQRNRRTQFTGQPPDFPSQCDSLSKQGPLRVDTYDRSVGIRTRHGHKIFQMEDSLEAFPPGEVEVTPRCVISVRWNRGPAHHLTPASDPAVHPSSQAGRQAFLWIQTTEAVPHTEQSRRSVIHRHRKHDQSYR
ncbi:hypothetical protein [Nocardia salmonicida]|uniref:hypothetical protein n=1 Tax=Nocardia salmonicida TaxID=53431 RepID=UPI0037AF4D43